MESESKSCIHFCLIFISGRVYPAPIGTPWSAGGEFLWKRLTLKERYLASLPWVNGLIQSASQSYQATAHIANKRRYAFFQDRYTNQGVFIPRVCSKRISGFDLFSSGMNSLCQVAFPFIGLFGTDRRMREISNLDLKGVQFHCSRKRDCKQHGKDLMVRNSNQLMAGITQRLIPLSAGMENGDWKDF